MEAFNGEPLLQLPLFRCEYRALVLPLLHLPYLHILTFRIHAAHYISHSTILGTKQPQIRPQIPKCA